MAGLIATVGPFRIRAERDRFRALARSIISQQISGSAAESIYRRFLLLFDPQDLSPDRLASLSPEQLRSAGLSSQKASYLLDLARRVTAGQLSLDKLGRASDHQIVEELTQVKGIGVWTAQMFLIFSLGRLDVFPADDLGVRVALRKLYALPELPDRKRSHEIAAPWRPFATIASWYCWRSLELPKQ